MKRLAGGTVGLIPPGATRGGVRGENQDERGNALRVDRSGSPRRHAFLTACLPDIIIEAVRRDASHPEGPATRCLSGREGDNLAVLA